MSVLGSILGAEKRFTAKTSDLVHWREMYPWLQEVAGERVTPQTAMGLAAYFACVRNIAEDQAKLPVDVVRKVGKNRTPVDHPVEYLLNVEPNPDMSAMDFRMTLTAHAAGVGNGYAQIVWEGARPVALWPLDPTTVKPKKEQGLLVYEVRGGGKTTVLMAGEVLHLRGLSNEGVVGYSIPTLGRQVLGAALAGQKFVSAFFGNGAWPGGVLEHPGNLSPGAHKNLTKTIEDRHRGAGAAHKLMILEEGMTYAAKATAPENAQLVEQMMFQVEEQCRYFRMPPHKVQHLLRATFSNIEEQSLEYVGDCLMPWWLRWEQEVKRKLFSATLERNLYLRHNVSALLRSDTAARSTYYSSMLQNGVYNINDVRAFEDMNGIGPEGDKYYHQMNLAEVGKEAPSPEASAPKALPAPDDEDEDELPEVVRGHRAALVDVYGRVLRVEADKAARAEKRGDLESWAEGFYPEHVTHVRAALQPVLTALAGSASALRGQHIDLTDCAAELTARHIARSRTELALGALQSWTNGRAASAADDAIEELLRLLTGEEDHAA